MILILGVMIWAFATGHWIVGLLLLLVLATQR